MIIKEQFSELDFSQIKAHIFKDGGDNKNNNLLNDFNNNFQEFTNNTQESNNNYNLINEINLNSQLNKNLKINTTSMIKQEKSYFDFLYNNNNKNNNQTKHNS